MSTEKPELSNALPNLDANLPEEVTEVLKSMHYGITRELLSEDYIKQYKENPTQKTLMRIALGHLNDREQGKGLTDEQKLARNKVSALLHTPTSEPATNELIKPKTEKQSEDLESVMVDGIELKKGSTLSEETLKKLTDRKHPVYPQGSATIKSIYRIENGDILIDIRDEKDDKFVTSKKELEKKETQSETWSFRGESLQSGNAVPPLLAGFLAEYLKSNDVVKKAVGDNPDNGVSLFMNATVADILPKRKGEDQKLLIKVPELGNFTVPTDTLDNMLGRTEKSLKRNEKKDTERAENREWAEGKRKMAEKNKEFGEAPYNLEGKNQYEYIDNKKIREAEEMLYTIDKEEEALKTLSEKLDETHVPDPARMKEADRLRQILAEYSELVAEVPAEQVYTGELPEETTTPTEETSPEENTKDGTNSQEDSADDIEEPRENDQKTASREESGGDLEAIQDIKTDPLFQIMKPHSGEKPSQKSIESLFAFKKRNPKTYNTMQELQDPKLSRDRLHKIADMINQESDNPEKAGTYSTYAIPTEIDGRRITLKVFDNKRVTLSVSFESTDTTNNEEPSSSTENKQEDVNQDNVKMLTEELRKIKEESADSKENLRKAKELLKKRKK